MLQTCAFTWSPLLGTLWELDLFLSIFENTTNNVLYFCFFAQGIYVRDAPLKNIKVFNVRRFVALFNVVNATKRDAGNYRCMIRTEGGVGVSNYAELIVKGIPQKKQYLHAKCMK